MFVGLPCPTAVEAGERLDFTGDMSQKIDPLSRPLYDALHELRGLKESPGIERNIVIAPGFYERSFFKESFIILDGSTKYHPRTDENVSY